jgi:SRSO17 transposase
MIFSVAMYVMDAAAVTRMQQYFADVGKVLGNKHRRASFATYAMGLLSEGERKSVEPIAARACGDPDRVDAEHQRLLHFLGVATWDDHAVRHFATRYALAEMTKREEMQAWIVDDTGFLKQGTHSVGVQRQYTGSAGKVTNCQLGVSLAVATPSEHLPVDFELYLPESWTEDAARRKEARIPDDVPFKTKLQLALDMIGRAVDNGIPPGVVLADSAYGTSSDFRHKVRALGLHFSLGVNSTTTVFELGEVVNRGGAAISVKELAFKLKKRGKFRRCTWRLGTKGGLSANFAARRVFPCKDTALEPDQREGLWLLIEWRDGEAEPANYFLSTLPKSTRKRELTRVTMQRWRTERTYEDLKGELGLDHYEGRRFGGWHHHVSVVLCCNAFVTTERVRHFSPSARGGSAPGPDRLAA